MKLDINLTPRQTECWNYLRKEDVQHRFIFYGGGAGGGKSYLGCTWIILSCLSYPGIRCFLARAELQELRKSTLVTFFKVCNDYGIDNRLYKYNAQFNYIDFANGSHIDLLALKLNPSDPDFQSIGSTEYTIGFIDEIGEKGVEQKAYEVLKSRVGRWKNDEYGLVPKILSSCNPSKTWVYIQMYQKWKNNILPPDTVFIRSLYTDNPFTAKSYGEQLDAIQIEADRERLKYGNWEYDEDETKLVEYDDILDLFDNTIEKDGNKYITCDVARYGGDTTTIAIWDGLELVNLIINNGEGTDTTARRLRELTKEYHIPYQHIVIDENGIGGGVIDQVRGTKGFINNSSPFKVKDTSLNSNKGEIRENFATLKDQCYFHLAEYVRDHKIRLSIKNDRRQQTIEELDACLRMDSISDDKKQRIIKKDKVKGIIGRSPDIADCIMMRMYFELHEKKHSGGISYIFKRPSLDSMSF